MKKLIFILICNLIVVYNQSICQWQWLGQLPTNENLSEVSFVNDYTGYALSFTSVLYKTTDAGQSWGLISDFYINFPPIKFEFKNESTGFMFYSYNSEYLLYKTSNGGINWFASYNTGEIIWDFDFINENTGFLTAGNKLYKTSNSGLDWVSVNTFPNQIHYVNFYNNDVGTAISFSPKKYWITNNGGSTWTLLYESFSPQKIIYINQNLIYSSNQYNVYKSTDGGMNWDDLGSHGNILYFENELTGYSKYINNFNRTTNGGNSWHSFIQSELKPTDKISFGMNNFYSVGDGGYIVKSTDRGISWISCTSSIINHARSLYFKNDLTGIVAGDDKIIKTNDGGSNWELITNLDSFAIKHISSPDNQNLFAACNNGYFGRSTNFGSNWTFSSTNFPVDFSKVYFVNSNKGFLIKYNSNVFYRTQDGGNTWIESNQIPNLKDLSFIDSLNGFAMSNSTNMIYRTTNGGISWFTAFTYPLPGLTLLNLIFVDSDNAIISVRYQASQTGFRFAIYNTTNSGQTWNQILFRNIFPDNNAGWIYNIQRTSDNVIIAQYGNFGLKSDDLGKTWNNIINPNTTEITYFFPSNKFGYIAGKNVIGKIGNGGIVNINNGNLNVLPTEYSLSQNYPNPFNPVTNIKFSIPTTQYTILKVFDITGREIARIVNEVLQAGSYEFMFDAAKLSSGVYFYQLKTDGFVQTRKMVLTK